VRPMTIPMLDLDELARACTAGDLAAFDAAAKHLGWTLDEAGREALLRAVDDTNYHHWYSYGVSAFSLAQAIGVIAEAATNASGVAITEQVRLLNLGKEVAIAFRDDQRIHFGVRYASNLPMTPGHLWPELKPWYKQLDRNRKQLERWVASAENLVSVARVERVASPSTTKGEDGQALLAAIIANPDDVAARLVYADWLLAHDDARGELIQLCEQRRSAPDPAIDARITELERSFAERIAGEVAQLASSYTLARGFVQRIEMAAPTFAKHGARLLATHPIEQLDLKPVNPQALARLARADALRRLRVLRLGQIIGKTRPMPFDDLCASEFFDSLEQLEVWTWTIDGKPEAAFARLRAPNLTRLRVYEVEGSPKILAGLARNEQVRLHHLSVDRRRRESWPSVFGGEGFEQLRSLALDIHGADASKLIDHANLPALRSLELDDDIEIDRLNFPKLRRLSLGEVECDAKSFARLLARMPDLQALRMWRLSGFEVARAVEIAMDLPPDHPLQVLSLPIDDPELAARLESRFSNDFHRGEEPEGRP
jgi:uncharacterized protein (TIGR02996 family)